MKRITAVAAWAACAIACAAEPRYAVVDLGVVLFQGVDKPVPAVSDSGYVGGITTFPASRGYVWKDGVLTTIASPLGPTAPSAVYDVNAAGVAVGSTPSTGTSGTFARPFVYRDGAVTIIPDLDAGPSVNARIAYGVNDAGVVVGEWERRGFVYRDGQSSALATPINRYGEAGAAGAYDINEAGWAVGYASYPSSFGAIVWRPDGSALDIGTLPLAADRRPQADGRAINDAGVVVGQSLTTLAGGALANHAFSWQDGRFTDLGSLRGPTWSSEAMAINDLGQIVGHADSVVSGGAFLWTAADGMVDLNALIDPASAWNLINATGINDQGWIVGNGTLGGAARDYLLVPLAPVPEPPVWLLLAGGVAATAWRRRVR